MKILVNEKGATVRRSSALHFCSAMRLVEYFDFLFELVPPQERNHAISEKDFNSMTPLHCAVVTMPSLPNANNYYAFAQKLISLGANKNARESHGRTPLGEYRSAFSQQNDFFTCAFGIIRPDDRPEAWRPFHEKMEGVLKPSLGETDADRQARLGVSHEEEEDMEVKDMDDDDEISVDDVDLNDHPPEIRKTRKVI